VATGPIAVEGAEPGDVLEGEIRNVRVNQDLGRIITTPGFGLLQDDVEIDHPATRITNADEKANTIEFEGSDVPIDPVIGTIGRATAEEAIPTLTSHDQGGNLDTDDMTGGALGQNYPGTTRTLNTLWSTVLPKVVDSRLFSRI